MTATADCTFDDGYQVLSVNFKIEIGTIVRAKEATEHADWCRCRVDDLSHWGLLVREIPEGPEPAEGTQFAATWGRVELIPEWSGFDSHVTRWPDGITREHLRLPNPNYKPADLGGKLNGMRFDINVGDIVQGSNGIDGDFIEGTVVSMTQDGVFLKSTEKSTQGKLFGSPWEGLYHRPKAANGLPITV